MMYMLDRGWAEEVMQPRSRLHRPPSDRDAARQRPQSARLAANGVREADELILPLGNAKTSPIAAVDVACVVATILDNPAPHIGQIYNLTGPESADVEHYASVFSEALGRTIRYRNVPVSAWSEKLRVLGVPEYLIKHLAVLADLHGQGRFDRMTDEVFKLTGQKPMSMSEFVKQHAAEFTRS
jgi:uncharacterized protein YbjT (DUF2867 family)